MKRTHFHQQEDEIDDDVDDVEQEAESTKSSK
jgi:hypothetical protein